MTLREATRILSAHGHPAPLTFSGRSMRVTIHYAQIALSSGGGWSLDPDAEIETIPSTRAALLAWLGY